jgi:DNA invertase Pin-like site-specific DNA recombinase
MQDQRSFSVPDPSRSGEGGQAIAERGGEATGDPQITPLAPAILYAAKSTKDERESIPDQLCEDHEWAETQSLEVLAGYSEEDVSAYKGDRGEELANAMQHAEMSGATLVVQHSDRLARGDAMQARHLVEVALWALKAGVRIHCVQDPSTFENLVMAAVMGERNTEDSRRKALAVKAGLARRRQRGLHNGGTAGYGYLYRRNADDERERVVDPSLVPMVRRIFAEYLTGRGYASIGRALDADGVPTHSGAPWNHCTVRAILINPIYAGLIRDGEELVPAQHEAIVDRETWEQAQALREAKTRTHKRGRPSAGKHLFRKGFLRCGTSGGSMGPLTRRSPSGTTYETYYCYEHRHDPGTCPMPSISRAAVDDAVYAYFRDLELDVQATCEQLAGAMERRLAEARELLGVAEQEERKAAGRLARVKGDYTSGDLTAAEWRELRVELEPEAADAEAEAENLRVQLAEVEAGTALTDVEVDVLEALSEIRKALADEVKDANGVAAIRAVLMRLFDGFVLHQGVPDGQDHVELAGTRYWIEPLVSERVVARYDAKFRPVVAQGDNCFDAIARRTDQPIRATWAAFAGRRRGGSSRR